MTSPTTEASFVAHEMLDLRPTGRKIYFQAATLEQAVQHCLYSERIKNGNVQLGPTGRVVYCSDGRSLVFPNPSSRNAHRPQ